MNTRKENMKKAKEVLSEDRKKREERLKGMGATELVREFVDDGIALATYESTMEQKKKWKAKYPLQVISVHSDAGGTGRTTISIALAQQLIKQGKRVCIVDCNDKSPSLQMHFPMNPESKNTNQYFSDWFTSYELETTKDLIQLIPGYDKQLGIIPGSMDFQDIANLDAFQRGQSANLGQYLFFQDRIQIMVSDLILSKGFDSVVLDNASGLPHLSYEVLMASLTFDASRVYVLRPRPADIALFGMGKECLFEPAFAKNSAIAMNFCDKDLASSSIHLIEAAEEFLLDYGLRTNIKDSFKKTLYGKLDSICNNNESYRCVSQPEQDFSIPYCPFVPELQDAKGIQLVGQDKLYLETVIQRSEKMQNLAKCLLDKLRD